MKQKEQNTDYKKRFLNGFNLLTRGSHAPYEVWQDLITVFALSIQNGCTRPLKDTSMFKDVWKNREQEYLRIINKYNKKERSLFPQMLALLVKEYEREPFQDLLGKIYMETGINNKNNGQFFTPYSICQTMAAVTMGRKEIGKQVHKQGYVNIYDCACGAGATLIAGVERCVTEVFKKYNWQNHIYCAGQDVDRTCALMCYIQLSFVPVAGYVTVGDSLSEPEITDINRIWFTPLWFSPAWVQRRFFGNYNLLMRRKGETKK